MKKNVMISVILIGMGVYFLLDAFSIMLFQNVFTWPTLLVIIGAAFLIQAYRAKEYYHILAGVLFGWIGLYFHFVHYFHVTLNLFELILLFFAIGYFLIFMKTGEGLFAGSLFLACGLFIVFLGPISATLHTYGLSDQLFAKIWPFLLIGLGGYLYLRGRKR